MFEQSDGWGERMWFRIEKAGRRRLVGRLENLPLGFPRLDYGSKIRFRSERIIGIDDDPAPPPCPECVDEARERLLASLHPGHVRRRRSMAAPAVSASDSSTTSAAGRTSRTDRRNGPKVEVPDDADVQTKLIAFLGGGPR